MNPLSFDEIAKHVAKKPASERAEACRDFERNLGWDSAKLLARANEIAAKGTTQ